ncbi:MAG: PBP1A family penicillin-binding protein [Clostridiales bacterium]|nr:PBP1A family penicillin-binding protein [Clostridiales bacterium]
MRKDSWSRNVRRTDRANEKENLREIKALDGKKKRVSKKTLLLSFLFLMAGAAAAFYFIFDVGSWQRLDLQKILSVPQTGAIYDRNGNFVTKIQSAQNRVSVPLSSVPVDVQNAFLAAEDLRFYQHSGFDLVRIFGAVAANFKSGDYSEGASTITQQLIKLSHLSTQKTIARKLEEIYLAIQLERVFTKEEILENYLNYIYFGRGAYGIEAAAQVYFGTSASELSAAQGACLAAIIKAPSLYAPHLDPSANQKRQQYILKTMYENAMLTEESYQAALSQEIIPIETTAHSTVYGWYIDAVLDEAEALLSLQAETLLGSGYHIYTALDTQQQDIIDTQFLSASNFPADASDGTKAQAAMASVDVNSGAVRAIAGGREYTVQRGLNRATQMRRQPGSALKPLAVYAPAIESHGYMTASVLDDSPQKFGTYSPRNSGHLYYGNVTIRTALKNSLNVAAVSLLNKIGVASARDYLQKTGIELDDRDWNLSLALGAMTYGVSPVQLAAAYAPFANGGLFYSPYFIERIEDAQGNILYAHEATGERVLSEQTAYLMTSLMQTVTASGTGAKLSGAGTPVAGKTGTVNMTGGGNRDIWMAAYNSQISTAFWMGFDNPDSTHKLQSWVSGGDYTAALATKFFKSYYSGNEKPAFKEPGGLVWLKIDTKAVEWAGETMLATSMTPKAYSVSEVFTVNNQPTAKSNVWSAPRTPSAFYVTHNNNGNPVLVITAADAGLYRIQRDAVGECIILNELQGNAGETLYYTDSKAVPGVVYTYRIIPINSELLNNGILLEGKQAVQIAQAKSPSTGSTLWDDITNLLFGASDSKEQENTQDALSLFWQSGE